MQTNQRDSLSDLKKTLFELDTDKWERWRFGRIYFVD